jgi:hypothetical protein
MPCAGGCAAVRRSRCDRSQRRGRVRRRQSRRGSGDDGRRGVCQSEGMDPFRSSTEVLRFVPWSGGPWPGKPGGATLAVGGAQRRASALAPIIQFPVDEHHVDLPHSPTVSAPLPHPPPSIPAVYTAGRCATVAQAAKPPSRQQRPTHSRHARLVLPTVCLDWPLRLRGTGPVARLGRSSAPSGGG